MSVQQSLFSLQTHGASSWARASAFLQSSYSWSASFRRGIDLGASFDLTGELKASVGGDTQVEAGIDGSFSAGAEIEAAFPLDLFGQCGLAARLMLEAEAAAYLSLDVKLSLADLRTLIAPKMGGVWLKLWDVFVTHANIEAGIWAKAAFAAEIGAEAVLAGNLLNTQDTSPGFTFSTKCGAGLGFTSGYHLITNFNFDSPQLLLDNISSIIINALNTEAQTYRKTLSPSDATLLDEAMMIASIAVPITTRTAYEIGVALTSNATNSTELALRSIVRSFIREGQEFLLRAITTAAFRFISKELNLPSLVTALKALTGDPHDAAVGGLLQLFSMVSKLETASFENPQSWVGIASGSCDAFMNFLGTNLITDTEEWKRRVAHIWVAAVLGQGVIKWIEDPNRASMTNAIFDNTPADSANNSPVAQYVASKIAKPPGTGLTLLDLLNYLLQDLPDLSTDLPEAVPVFSFLQKALNNNNSSIVKAMFQDFTEADAGLNSAAVTTLTSSIASALTNAITSKIQPAILTPFASNPQVGDVLNQIIGPALTALSSVVLPAVSTATTGTAIVVREQVSAVLIQFFANIILTTANNLVDKGITDGSQFLIQVANDLSNFGSLVDLIVIAVSAAYGTVMTTEDIKDFLLMISDTMNHWNSKWREEMFQNLKSVLSLGLQTDTSQLVALAKSPFLPPSTSLLLSAVKTFLDMSGDMLFFIGLRAIELYLKHFLNIAIAIGKAIEQGAEAIFSVIKGALQTINQGITDLASFINNLTSQLLSYTAQIAADIQSAFCQAQNMVDQFFNWIHDQVWQDVQTFLQEATIGWAADLLKPIYDGIFQVFKTVLDAPFLVVENIAGWINNEITSAMNSGFFDLPTIATNIRNSALALGEKDWIIHLGGGVLPSADIPIPGSRLIGIVIDELLKDIGIMKILNDIIAAGTNASSTQAQIATAQAQQDGTISQQESQTLVITSLQATGTLAVSIDSPLDQSLNQDFAICKITVSGANDSFIDTTMGLPQRITIQVNGSGFPYSTQNWYKDASGNLVFEGALYKKDLLLVAARTISAYHFAPLDIGTNQIMKPEPSIGGMPTFKLNPVKVPGKVIAIAPTRTMIGVGGSLFQSTQLPNNNILQPVLVQPTGQRPATPLELAQGNNWFVAHGSRFVGTKLLPQPPPHPPHPPPSTGGPQDVKISPTQIEFGLVISGSVSNATIFLTPPTPTDTTVTASFINDTSGGAFQIKTLSSYYMVESDMTVPIPGHPGHWRTIKVYDRQLSNQTNGSPLAFSRGDFNVTVEISFNAPAISPAEYTATLQVKANGWNDVTIPLHVIVGNVPSGDSPMAARPGLNTLHVTVSDGSGNPPVVQECHFYLT